VYPYAHKRRDKLTEQVLQVQALHSPEQQLQAQGDMLLIESKMGPRVDKY